MTERTIGPARTNVKAAVAVIGAGVVLAGVGFVAGRGSASRTAAAGRPGAVAPAPGRTGALADHLCRTGGPRLVSGVPVGYPRTRSGVLSAAANYTAAFGSALVLTASGRDGLARAVEPAGLGNEVRTRLAQAPKSRLLAGLDADRRAGRPMVLQTVPLRLRVLGSYGPARSRVAVYAATYVAGSQSTATVGHGTEVLDLVWWRGDWKLRSITNRPETGPIPAGYDAPPNGWQPGPGGNLVDASEQVRDAMSGGAVPTYVVP